MNTIESFKIDNKVFIITGGAGLLGKKHAEAVIDGGGIPVLLDISAVALEKAKKELAGDESITIETYVADITKEEQLIAIKNDLIKKYDRVDGLINNAANNPKVEDKSENLNHRFESFSQSMWYEDIEVGLTGAMLCSKVFGSYMASRGEGVILNISSDLGIIAPDQRIYQKKDVKDEEQMVKPVTYSVIKHGLIGLTKYLATYWADKGIRVNALCPAGISNGQDEEFLCKLENLIPMGRMANVDEYKATVLYLLSEASSYMTGSTMIVDGGRTCW